MRNRKPAGKKFVRQYPIKINYEGGIRFFIADFYCHESRLIIELDGYRTFIINQLGMRVLRIKNEELKDIPAVTAKIKDFL